MSVTHHERHSNPISRSRVNMMIALTFLPWLTACESPGTKDVLVYECAIPTDFERNLIFKDNDGNKVLVDGYKKYLEVHFDGWIECVDRFVHRAPSPELDENAVVYSPEHPFSRRVRQAGFRQGQAQIDLLIQRVGEERAREIADHHPLHPERLRAGGSER